MRVILRRLRRRQPDLLPAAAESTPLDEEIDRPQHHVAQYLSDRTCAGSALALGARRRSPLPRRQPVKQRPDQQIDSDEHEDHEHAAERGFASPATAEAATAPVASSAAE